MRSIGSHQLAIFVLFAMPIATCQSKIIIKTSLTGNYT